MPAYLPYLAATVVVELLVVLAISRWRRLEIPWSDVVILNLVTHPIATALVHADAVGFWPVEVGVLVAETLGYTWLTRLPLPTAFAVALTANTITAALSFLV